uniref:Uma2 family endonuclease n=1 Tax=Desulfosoma caldarium TaxID=610254 RepID=UPI001B8670D2
MQVPHNWISVVLHWICEVLSSATAVRDQVVKMPLYARHGVKHLWLLDPTFALWKCLCWKMTVGWWPARLPNRQR